MSNEEVPQKTKEEMAMEIEEMKKFIEKQKGDLVTSLRVGHECYQRSLEFSNINEEQKSTIEKLSAKQTRFVQEIKDLMEEIDQMKEERKTRQSSFEELSEKLSDSRSEVFRLEGFCEQLKEARTALRVELMSLKSTEGNVEEKKEIETQLNDRIARLKRTNADLSQQLSESKSTNAKLQGHMDVMEEKVKEKKEKKEVRQRVSTSDLVKIRQEYDRQISTLQDELSEVEEKRRSELKVMTTEWKRYERELVENSQMVTEKLQEENSDLLSRVRKLESLLSQRQAEEESESEKLNQYFSDQQNQKYIDEISNLREELSRKSTRHEMILQSREERISELEELVEQLQKKKVKPKPRIVVVPPKEEVVVKTRAPEKDEVPKPTKKDVVPTIVKNQSKPKPISKPKPKHKFKAPEPRILEEKRLKFDRLFGHGNSILRKRSNSGYAEVVDDPLAPNPDARKKITELRRQKVVEEYEKTVRSSLKKKLPHFEEKKEEQGLKLERMSLHEIGAYYDVDGEDFIGKEYRRRENMGNKDDSICKVS